MGSFVLGVEDDSNKLLFSWRKENNDNSFQGICLFPPIDLCRLFRKAQHNLKTLAQLKSETILQTTLQKEKTNQTKGDLVTCCVHVHLQNVPDLKSKILW